MLKGVPTMQAPMNGDEATDEGQPTRRQRGRMGRRRVEAEKAAPSSCPDLVAIAVPLGLEGHTSAHDVLCGLCGALREFTAWVYLAALWQGPHHLYC